MTQRASNKKVANKLVGASCAAVLTVYAAGYARTQKAADRLAAQISDVRKAQHPVPEQTIYRFKPLPRTPNVPAGVYSSVASASPKPRVDREPTRIATLTKGPSATAEPSPVAPASAPVSELAAAPVEAAVIASPAVLPVESAPAKPTWKDGVYTGWGYSRHGNIEAAVVIESGRIASATISQCRTRYSCSVIDKLPPQVAQRQSPDVDYVSGATQSADAFYGAVAEALSKAQ